MERARFILQLATAVLLGALTACAPVFGFELLVLIATPAAFGDTVAFAAAFFGIAVAIIVCASVLLGLPLTIALRSRGLEKGKIYVGLGAAFGAFIAMVLVPAILGVKDVLLSYVMLMPLSALSGSVTAWTWWRFRKVRYSNVTTADLAGS